jgi:internalin A
VAPGSRSVWAAAMYASDASITIMQTQRNSCGVQNRRGRELTDNIARALLDARETGLLRIHDEPLGEVPREVRELPDLRELRLAGCSIHTLPDWLSELTSLTHIELAGNPISDLPHTFDELQSLRVLGLSNTRIETLEPVLSELGALEMLVLSGARVNELPWWIGDLSRLRVLDLGANPIASLPEGMAGLRRLTHLYLWGHRLRRIPDVLLSLVHLEVLDLSRCGSHDLGDSSREVARHFAPPEFVGRIIGQGDQRGKLSVLPAELAEMLPSLRGLFLGGQQFRSLPAALPPRLEGVFLANNQIGTFPRVLLEASELRELDLSNNKLSDLPQDIARLDRLTYLDLAKNPLPVPPEVLAETTAPDAIMEYLADVQGPTRPLDQAKLLVVGEGSVGKTSLIKRLLSSDFSEHEEKTEGIEIKNWSIDVGDDPILLNIWDFGGQEIMHATHQFFLTKRSLYVLVVDARQGEEQNRIEYWLKLIQSFADTSPIVIVVNKTEESAMDIDSRGLRAKYPDIVGILPVSCKTGSGIKDVKQVLAASIEHMPHVRDPLPAAFFDVKQELEQSDANYLSFDDYTRMCRRLNVTDRRAQERLVGFLHDLGTVLCFHDDPRLSDTHILNPAWVTGGVYRLLNSHLAAQRKGLLEWEDVNKILDIPEYPPERRPFIIDMMKRFELCYESDGIFLVPDLLTKQEPDTGKWDDALRFEIKYDVLPTSIISRLIVRMHTEISKGTVWRTGLVLAMDGNRGLVKGDREDAVIRIEVTGGRNRRGLLTAIRAELRDITRSVAGLTGEERVPIPGHPDVLVPYTHLLALEEKGRDTVIPEGLTEDISIRELLDGVESPDARVREPPTDSRGARRSASPDTPPTAAGSWSQRETTRMIFTATFAVICVIAAFVVANLVLGPVAGAEALSGAIVAAVVIFVVAMRFGEYISEDVMLAVVKLFRK